jgi:inner membrane protein involved in colicin E2 resistance
VFGCKLFSARIHFWIHIFSLFTKRQTIDKQQPPTMGFPIIEATTMAHNTRAIAMGVTASDLINPLQILSLENKRAVKSEEYAVLFLTCDILAGFYFEICSHAAVHLVWIPT